jgi:hypothetical protein
MTNDQWQSVLLVAAALLLFCGGIAAGQEGAVSDTDLSPALTKLAELGAAQEKAEQEAKDDSMMVAQAKSVVEMTAARLADLKTKAAANPSDAQTAREVEAVSQALKDSQDALAAAAAKEAVADAKVKTLERAIAELKAMVDKLRAAGAQGANAQSPEVTVSPQAQAKADVAEAAQELKPEWESSVPPGMKITVHPPDAWTVRQDAANAASRSMDIWASSRAMGSALLLKFTADKGGVLASQAAVDELVRKENAKFAQYAEGSRIDVVEMKSASGFGAYAVYKVGGSESANRINYTNCYRGRFVMKGIVISFTVRGDPEGTLTPQLVKFIEEGITVE